MMLIITIVGTMTREPSTKTGRKAGKERIMSENRPMTQEEKELLQAQHRLEEAEARQRVKERKARTRRLIQEGAILESIVPWVANIDLDALKRILEGRLKDL